MAMRGMRYGLGLAALCGCFVLGSASEARADYEELMGPELSSGAYAAKVETEGVLYVSMTSDEVLRETEAGEYYLVLGDEGSGWLEVQAGETVGYLSAEEISIVGQEEMEAAEMAAAAEETARQQASADRRQALVDYAMQFLGCSYREQGSSPDTGFDCSGFTRYVMQNGAGVSINRSSSSQAGQGTPVSAENIRPGDLVFYASGGSINHVAMYVGNGQVIHASTYKTGVKLSPWTYRTPVKIVNMLGD